MKPNQTYEELVHKMQEISALPQQTVGPFTPLYRSVIPYVKDAPLRWLAIGSFVTSIVFYLVFGALVVRLVSILQHGF